MDRQKHLRKKPYLLILWLCERQECRHRQLPAGGCLPPDCCSVSSDGQPGVSVQLSAPAPSPLSHSLSARHKNNGHLLFTAEVIKRWSSFLTFSSAVLYVWCILRPRVTVTLCKVRQTGHIVTACQSEEIKFRIYPGLFYDQLKESIKRYLNPIINEIILSIQIWQFCNVKTWTCRHDR